MKSKVENGLVKSLFTRLKTPIYALDWQTEAEMGVKVIQVAH